jgi:hypothetical protein
LQTEYLMRPWKFLLPLLASTVCFAAQADRITGAISSNQTFALPKSHHPKALPQYDQGPVSPSMKLGYITMLMTPSASEQAALNQLLEEQQDRSSPNYHKWLTPQQFADQFGLSQNDLSKVTAWLKSQGFQILSVGGSRNSIAFSGTAAQAESAFKTQIHYYKVDGITHFANSTPLMIPSALNGIVETVLGLHSFLPRPASQMRGGGIRNARPAYYDNNFVFPNFLAPDDVATIYDIASLYNAASPISGAGETLGIIGQTDIYLADIADFRSGFNLNPITGCTTGSTGLVTACNSTYFQYVLVGSDPGIASTCGDLPEADLDVEWSGATAREAQVVFFNSPSTFNSDCTEYTNGQSVNSALAAAIDPSSGPVLAHVLSMSYGLCEAESESMESLLQQGNAEGVTVMIAAGDQSSAACDGNPPNNEVNPPFSPAVNGLAVSYPASSPEVTAVGGTSISLANDSYPTQSSYWSTTEGPNLGTALSYIPEQPWNDDEEFADYCHDPASGDEFCSTGNGTTDWVALTTSATAAQVQADIWIDGGSGGASNCFYQNAGTGECLGAGAGPTGGGLAQPSYQQGLHVSGAPAGVRYIPDVALLSSPDFPGYIYCTPVGQLEGNSDTTSSCAGGIPNALNNGTYVSAVGGTSVASPIFAGIVTLLNQSIFGPSSPGLGNINSQLYTFAAANSTNHAFHSVTSGDNDVYCESGQPSSEPTNIQCPSSGVMGYSAANFDSSTDYNLVDGLGSVDVNNLVTAWGANRSSTSTTISTTTTTIYQGASVTFTSTVTPSTATGNVDFYNNDATNLLGVATVSGGTATFTTTALPAGTDVVIAAYGGNTSNSGSTTTATPSNSATVTVTVPFTMSPNPPSQSVSAGNSIPVTLTITPASGFTGTVNFTPSSCTGLPAGATCSFGNGGSVTLNGSSPSTISMTIATAANVEPTSVPVTITGTSGTATETTSVTLTVTATSQTFSIAAQNASYSVPAGQTATINLTVTPSNGFSPSSLPLTFTCSGLPSEATGSFSPGGGQGCLSGSISQNTLTLNIATTAPTSQLRPPLRHGRAFFYALLLPGIFGVVLAGASRTKSARLLGMIVVLGLSTLWLGSCGGSSSSSGGTSNPGTPAGTYTVTIGAATQSGTGLVTLKNSNTPYTIQLIVTN